MTKGKRNCTFDPTDFHLPRLSHIEKNGRRFTGETGTQFIRRNLPNLIGGGGAPEGELRTAHRPLVDVRLRREYRIVFFLCREFRES